ncbi:hypothetical protein JYT31_00710 [Beggiatoa alba]|nr:hypothetical protein [Beggiatoa alba]
MKKIIHKFGRKQYMASVLSVGLVIGLQGCGGGGGGSETVAVSGVVSTPGGAIAFNQPSGIKTFFASFFAAPAHAAISGTAPVGAGVTVNLIEVDAAGSQVGAIIASATTDAGGAFAINAPQGFVPSSKYVIRAEGSTTNLDSRVTSLTPNVDPLTDAASTITADKTLDLSALSVSEMDEITAAVDDIAQNIDASTLSTSALTAALVDEAKASEEVSNIASSTTSGGQICGKVKDSTNTPVANIRIVVRDFGQWVTRAKTKTDASGDYCVNVPIAGATDPNISGATLSGKYILGALNFTSTSLAASQWWTSTSSNADGSGGANNQFSGQQIDIPSAVTLTRDIVLDANGSRIIGTVTGGTANVPLEGMRVVIRNYDTFKPLTSAKVKADGTYRVNVKATDYLITFRNRTRHPYASEVHDDASGAINRNLATRETMVAGATQTYDANLVSGVVIAGIITDGGVAVSGTVVRVNNADGGRIENLRTNRKGKFRIWVNPRLDSGLLTPYTLVAYGQSMPADTNGDDGSTPTSFKLSNGTNLTASAPVTTVSGRLVAADGVTPVPLGVVFLKKVETTPSNDTSGTVDSMVSKATAVSNADGSFTLHTDETGVHLLSVRMDDNINFGSGVYDNDSNISAVSHKNAGLFDVADLSVAVNLGTDIRMPTLGAGNSVGYLKGNVGVGSKKVFIRIGGTSGTNSLNDMATTLTRGDGSYKVTLPAVVTYDRIRSRSGNCDGRSITAGGTITLNFDGTGTPPCEP